MKILVTGSCGFIGSAVTNELLNQGIDVIGIDSLNDLLYPKIVKETRLTKLKSYRNFSFYQLNLAKESLDGLLEGVDFIINEAGLPGQLLSWSKFNDYVESNLISLHRILEAAGNLNNPPKIVQASTSSVYGSNAWGDELQELTPCSPYGVTKLAAENLLASYKSSAGLDYIVLRYFSVYGPGQRSDMAIDIFFHKILTGEAINVFGEGDQLRDFTYISDVVKGTLSSLENGNSGEKYNISSGRPISLNELIQLCFEVSGKSVPIIYKQKSRGDQDKTYGDNSKAFHNLNFKPETDLREGLTLQWEKLKLDFFS